MLTVQARAVELLKEIDDICISNGINYSLAGRTAIMQSVAEGFTCSDYRPEIMMPPTDYRKFCMAVADRKNTSRTIESLETNPLVDGLYARYVDTSTTLIDIKRGHMFREQGVHVLIWILRSKMPSSKYGKTLNKIVKSNDIVSTKVKKEYCSEKARIKYSLLDVARLILRNPGSMKKYFDDATSEDGNSRSLFYVDSADGDKKIVVPRKSLNNYHRVFFEGSEVMVIDDIETVLKMNYGNSPSEAVKTAVCPAGEWCVYYDLRHPFKQVIKEAEAKGTDFARLAEEKYEFDEFSAKVYRKRLAESNKQYRYVRRTIDRFRLMEKYYGRAAEIKAMYSAGKFDETREALSDYIEKIESYSRRKMGFSMDRELLEIAYQIMEQDGKGSIIKEAKKLLPNEFKEDLADWLAAEGFERESSQIEKEEQK